MKCISTQAPWAWFILLGLKPVENRSWPASYRGPLLIHIGRTYDHDGAMYLCSVPAFRDDVNRYLDFCGGMETRLPVGVIAGKVNMVDCVTSHPSLYFFGSFGHVYQDPVIFKNPIPYKGSQRIFNVPDKIIIEGGYCHA